MPRTLVPLAAVAAALSVAHLSAGALGAQEVQRFTLDGAEVAVYNLVGTMRVEGGAGDRVVVEVTRAGRDAGRLTIDTSPVRGRSALRVRYPEDRVSYPRKNGEWRSSFSVNDDGTFGDGGSGWMRDRRRIEVTGRDGGFEAHADVRVIVPAGRSVFVRQGVGETTVENVNGRLDLSVAASHVRVARVRGTLVLDTGSGGVEVSDLTGDLDLDSGSGGAVLDGVRGGTLRMDVGSGSLRGRSIDVRELVADVGSGGVRLTDVRAPKVRLETGSGGSDLQLLGPVEDVSIEAGSGGVTLRLPAATGARVDIESGSGGIDTDFEVRVERMQRRALHGTLGDGRGRIRIESGSGTIRLLKN